MSLFAFLSVSFVVLALAYRFMGRFLERMFNLAHDKTTPAHTMRDGLDYEPAKASYLLPQHFSAIAAAGPIVGPILAGLYFGWGPAWLWIIFGCILIGGVHDFTTLVASVRHGARSITELVREYMNPRAYFLFLAFVWFSLIYVIIAFTDVTAATFVQASTLEGAQAPGPAVATSSILYLGLAVIMGLTLRLTGMNPDKANWIFLPLVIVAIVAGVEMPIALRVSNPQMVWGYILLIYCFVAALLPLWLLLQPRGNLGGYFLYVVMIAGILGIMVSAFTGAHTIEYPFFTGWHAPEKLGGSPLFPILFITVACGACSGFHSIVASGTTCKQLNCERDARAIGYGGMLLEGFFACISLATLMIVAQPSGKPDAIYAAGIADFSRQILAPLWPIKDKIGADVGYVYLYQFALLCFATFVFDTLDACTRLARYVLMEAFGWKSRASMFVATAVTLAIPALVLLSPPVTVDGNVQPLWRVFWGMFGSSNQLLASLALLGITVWLARKKMAWQITFPPAIFLMLMTLWSLALNVKNYALKQQSAVSIAPMVHVQFAITCSLIVLSLWLLVESVITLRTTLWRPGPL